MALVPYGSHSISALAASSLQHHVDSHLCFGMLPLARAWPVAEALREARHASLLGQARHCAAEAEGHRRERAHRVAEEADAAGGTLPVRRGGDFPAALSRACCAMPSK